MIPSGADLRRLVACRPTEAEARAWLGGRVDVPIDTRWVAARSRGERGRVLAVETRALPGGPPTRWAGELPGEPDGGDLPPDTAVPPEALVLVVGGRGWSRWLPEALRPPSPGGGPGFVDRLLLLCEERWEELERQADSLPAAFRPATAPPPFLRLLASWVGAPPGLDDDALRDLIPGAVARNRRRGIPEAVEEAVRHASGLEVRILAGAGPPGLPLGGRGRAGAPLGRPDAPAWLGGPGPGGCPHWVTAVLPHPGDVAARYGTTDAAERLCRARKALLRELPAHLHLHIVAAPPRGGGSEP